jgi:hypothetical protein
MTMTLKEALLGGPGRTIDFAAIRARIGPSMSHYRGWTLDFNPQRPRTGTWKAQRYGVSMCAASLTALQAMIDLNEPLHWRPAP